MTKHRTMQGREVDMEKLMRQNELMPAIGNVRVNARGDELGPGGKIIKKREDVLAEYYENNPKAIPESVTPVKSQQVPPTIVGHGTNSRKTKPNEEV
jgi:ribosomal protein S17E